MKSTNELKEFRTKNSKDLGIDLNKQYKKLRELKFSQEFSKTKDVKSINKVKKSIARIWTILGEKMTESKEK